MGLIGDGYCVENYTTPECFVEPGDVVVDIGAFIGEFSSYASMMGASAVFAYEPCQTPFVELKARNIPNCVALNRAVGKEAKLQTVYWQPEAPMASTTLRKSDFPEVVQQDSFEEILRTLDKVDFLKIDCEGSEREFLPGADLRKVKKLAVEWHLKEVGDYVPPLRFIKEILSDFKVVAKLPTPSKGLVYTHLLIFVAWRIR